MDEIYKKLLTEYDSDYTKLLENFLQFVKKTDKLGQEIVGLNLIQSDELSIEKKKIIQQIVQNVALSSHHLLLLRRLINKL
jgi:hypothetical protein